MPQRTQMLLHNAPGRGDRFDALVSSIGFVIHREKPLNWSVNHSGNPHYDILAFAVDGRAWYRCGNERFEATRGMVMFFPRGTAHSAETDPKNPWSFYSIGFRLEPPTALEQLRRPPKAHTIPDAFSTLPHRQRLANIPQVHDWFRQLYRLWIAREPGYSMACRGLILQLMHYYTHAAQHTQHRIPHTQAIQKIVEQMHANVGRMYTVNTLAKQANLSPSRFGLLFRELTGCSVTRYQNQLRIEAAHDMLASGQYTVGQVADELGFRDVYYFSRLFKRFTDSPPSVVRHR